MGKNEEIIEKIQQIIKVSTQCYVYVDECASIAKLLNELLNKISNIQYDKADDQIYNQILYQLNNIYIILNGFQQKEWLKVYLIQPVNKPFTLLKESTDSLSESLAKINVKLDNQYQILDESVTNELNAIYWILEDPSLQNQPEVKEKQKEIKKHLKSINRPLFKTSHKKSKKKKKSHKKSKSKEKVEQKSDTTEEEEEFNDFSNIQKYKISTSDYIKDPQEIFECHKYTLYQGKMKSSNEEVNIIELSESEYPIEKLQRIVNVLITAQHPNLEKFIGYVSSEQPYVVVTRKSGPKLNEILLQPKKRRKKSDNANSDDTPSIWENGNRTIIAFKIASAMAYLHSLNIIHRDLCSSNITIDENLNPRISNFVNSRFLPEDLDLLSTKQFSSDDFRAPELAGDDNYDETVDVFSFGGILYELLTGKKPFSGMTVTDVEEQIKSNKRPEMPETVSTDLRRLIESCWAHYKEQRPSFADVIDSMITQRISFPKDSKYVKQFYSSRSVKNDYLNNCLDYFKQIKEAIDDQSEYIREILRIRSYLHAYQFILQNSRYAIQNSFESNAILITFESLERSLENLLYVVNLSRDENWIDYAPSNPATEIPLTIYQSMEDIYIAMKKLGFKVSKYEFVNSDLIIDFRSVYAQFKQVENELPLAPIRLKEINDFLHKRGLKIEVTNEEINEQLSNTFKPFNDFYRNRNDFKKLKMLGKGYTSIVYRAKQFSTNQFVAIKEFSERYLKEDGGMPYLKREVASLVKLNHKYLISFVGFNNDPNEKLWIITKIVEGGDLYNAICVTRKLNAFQKTKIAFEIAEGMEYLHSKRVIHRDLKSGNILLDGNTPKITDFGYSRTDSYQMSNQIGTINYMSPEIIKGKDYSFATDVFSYALLLWEMYYEMIPYTWSDDIIIEDEILNNAPLPYEKPISQDLLNLIEDAKKIKPSSRPTFSQIIKRMIKKKIHFDGADEDQIEAFYDMKKLERNS